MRIRSSSVSRQILSLLMVAIGIIMVLVAREWPKTWLESAVTNLGLAVLIAGTVNYVHEKLFIRTQSEELEEGVAGRVQRQLQPDLKSVESLVERKSEELEGLIDRQVRGLRWLTDNRRDCPDYYTWPFAHGTKDLFFAGISVLHRMDTGLREHGIRSLEEALVRKLQEGTDIRILFLDPRSDLIRRIADDEDREKEEILGDIATTVGICRRLYLLLEQLEEKPRASLFVGMHDRSPCFSYHKEDEKVIVGLYIPTRPKRQNSAFEALDPHTMELFRQYVDHIQSEATPLLTVDGTISGNPTFRDTTYRQIYDALADRLNGAEKVDELMARSEQRESRAPKTSAVRASDLAGLDSGDGEGR